MRFSAQSEEFRFLLVCEQGPCPGHTEPTYGAGGPHIQAGARGQCAGLHAKGQCRTLPKGSILPFRSHDLLDLAASVFDTFYIISHCMLSLRPASEGAEEMHGKHGQTKTRFLSLGPG